MTKKFEFTCRVCNEGYEDSIDMEFMCVDCENEYAEWLDEKGFIVGEFDAYDHPDFVPDPHAGTKWAVLDK